MSCKDLLIGQLKARRVALGWSTKQLGERCGLDEALLEQWERGAGSPRLESVAAWAGALGLALSVAAVEGDVRRGLHVDWQNHLISLDGTPVRLTPMEWKALERLAAAPGELVPHIALFRHLYGENEPYRAQSTAIRVLITKLRRLLPPLRIEAQWGRGYVISGVAASAPCAGKDIGTAPEPRAPSPPKLEERPREPVARASRPIMIDSAALRRKLAEIVRPETHRAPSPAACPSQGRAEELLVIERFLAERGVTRCPDVATIQHAPLPTLEWDKMKRKWVRPTGAAREVG